MTRELLSPKVLIYYKLDSTYLEALRILNDISSACWLIAYEQFGGLGSYGRLGIHASEIFRAVYFSSQLVMSLNLLKEVLLLHWLYEILLLNLKFLPT